MDESIDYSSSSNVAADVTSAASERGGSFMGNSHRFAVARDSLSR
jgi:hypothetical protein